MQLSSLIGKPVLSPSGESLGYVKDCYLGKNCNALSALACVDGEEEEFFLPARAILSLGDAVIAGNARLTLPTGIKSPVGGAVYSAYGEFLGVVREMTIEKDNAFVTVEKGEIKTECNVKRLVIGEAVIAYAEGMKKPAGKQRPSQEKTPTTPTEPENTAATECIANETLYQGNLLGKRAKQSITDEKGMPLIRAGEIITPAAIRKAGQCNRLLQLSASAFER